VRAQGLPRPARLLAIDVTFLDPSRGPAGFTDDQAARQQVRPTARSLPQRSPCARSSSHDQPPPSTRLVPVADDPHTTPRRHGAVCERTVAWPTPARSSGVTSPGPSGRSTCPADRTARRAAPDRCAALRGQARRWRKRRSRHRCLGTSAASREVSPHSATSITHEGHRRSPYPRQRKGEPMNRTVTTTERSSASPSRPSASSPAAIKAAMDPGVAATSLRIRILRGIGDDIRCAVVVPSRSAD
jgi:hypothetical protein